MAFINIWAAAVVIVQCKAWFTPTFHPTLLVYADLCENYELTRKRWKSDVPVDRIHCLQDIHQCLHMFCHPHPHSCPVHISNMHSQQCWHNLLNIHNCSPNTHQYLHKLCYLLKPGSLEAIHQSESIKQKGMFHLACRHNMQILGCWCKDGDRIFLLLVDIHLCPLKVKYFFLQNPIKLFLLHKSSSQYQE